MKAKKSYLSYVLVTPVRNEECNIERTIQSVISQTVLPTVWIIVSDGSTDRTDSIVQRYCKNHDWIRFIRRPEHNGREFAAKVHSFKAGYNEIRGIDYDIIGNLDADASFESDYFQYLLERFEDDPKLGVAGTAFIENGKQTYDYNFTNIEHVTGIIQLFRRQCFEEIGGYTPVKAGGIDWIAVTTARMRGWKTRTFLEKSYVHHRRMGTASANVLMAKFQYGEKDFFLGGHVLWELLRAMYQMTKKPYIIGGVLLISGYLWACFRGVEKPITNELITFHKQEQINRIRDFLVRLCRS
jgi:glycosyltransferase involved in cell wall biosynthesis